VNERERRVGENEALFRQVNERLEGLSGDLGWVTGTLQIVCECGDATCVDRIELAPEAYRAVRADPTTFALVPGHHDPSVEHVVDENDGWVVIRKDAGPPAELAEKTAPRPS